MSKKIIEAWRSTELFEAGIGHVVVARRKASGAADVVTAGVFLLDMYCLGVKDAFLTRVPAKNWDATLERIFPAGKESLTPACGRKLIEDAIAYARGFGLEPHSDYERASHTLSGIDASQCQTTFTFGKDGKPFYIQGPHDSPLFVHRVFDALGKSTGRAGDKFHYIVNAESMDPQGEQGEPRLIQEWLRGERGEAGSGPRY